MPVPNDILASLDAIENLAPEHVSLGKEMLEADNGTFYGMDLLTLGALNRSLDHLSGFQSLIRGGSWLSAGALLRVQLDTALRYLAATLVDDPHEFAGAVMGGAKIRNMEDREGKKMTDAYLVSKLGERYPWIPASYEKMSGYVHLSSEHLSAPFYASGDDVTRTVEFEIGSMKGEVPHFIYVQLTTTFLLATEIFLEYAGNWVATKKFVASSRQS